MDPLRAKIDEIELRREERAKAERVESMRKQTYRDEFEIARSRAEQEIKKLATFSDDEMSPRERSEHTAAFSLKVEECTAELRKIAAGDYSGMGTRVVHARLPLKDTDGMMAALSSLASNGSKATDQPSIVPGDPSGTMGVADLSKSCLIEGPTSLHDNPHLAIAIEEVTNRWSKELMRVGDDDEKVAAALEGLVANLAQVYLGDHFENAVRKFGADRYGHNNNLGLPFELIRQSAYGIPKARDNRAKIEELARLEQDGSMVRAIAFGGGPETYRQAQETRAGRLRGIEARLAERRQDPHDERLKKLRAYAAESGKTEDEVIDEAYKAKYGLKNSPARSTVGLYKSRKFPGLVPKGSKACGETMKLQLDAVIDGLVVVSK